MIDSTRAVTKELHGPAIEPELPKDCDSIEVIDISEAEVQEHSSRTDGCAELAVDAKCSPGAQQIRIARFVSKEGSSVGRAKLWEVCKPSEGLPSEDRTALSDISNKSEGPGTDRADPAAVGSSKVLNVKLRRLYRSMNVAVPRPLPSLVELMGASKRPRASQFLHL